MSNILPFRCEVCGGKQYIISTRDDGYEAVEACDVCVPYISPHTCADRDEIAAWLAERDGIAALHNYPCYVIGKIAS